VMSKGNITNNYYKNPYKKHLTKKVSSLNHWMIN